ncbi:MAG: hypothetical protein QXT64_05025 [Desulfurococcaceae archaeon]
MDGVVLGIAWVVAVVIMATVFITLVKSGQTARKALMWSLIVGKVIATIYLVTGLDRTLLIVSYVRDGAKLSFGLTANMLILTALLITNLVNYLVREDMVKWLKEQL